MFELFSSRRMRRRDVVGLDIGHRAIKAIRRDRGRVVARNVVPWQAPEDLGDDDAVGVLGEAIRRAVATFGLRRAHPTVCVLSLSFGTLRSFELPASTADVLQEMVRQEFSDDAKLDPSLAEVAVWAAPTRSDLQSVSGWALEHGVSRYVAREVTHVGLDCTLIDALPFALARATGELAGGAAEGPLAVVDWGAWTPSLTIVQRGRPLFTRALRECGHAGVVDRLSDGLSLSTDEAWDFFDNFGPRTDAVPEMRQLLDEYAREVSAKLVAEIERTVDFLAERISSLSPRTIVLFGGGAELIRAPLREAFGPRVVTWAESLPTQSGDATGIAGSVLGAAFAVASPEVVS